MTHTPDQLSTTITEVSPAAAELLTVEKVEEWRSLQHDTLAEQRDSSALDESYDRFLSDIDIQLGEFLQANGIDESNTNYDELRQIYRAASIDRVSTSEWYASAESRGVPGDMPAYSRQLADQFEARLATLLVTPDMSVTPDASPPLTDAERQVRDAEFTRLEAELTDARELYAAAAAKRQGRLFGKGGKGHDQLRQDYEAKLHALGQRHMAEHPDYDDESKRLIATTILFDEQEKLRNLTTEKLLDTKVSKIIRWMNKGGTATRIAKGVGIGIVAGAAGSFLAGAVGAGIIAGGTVLATRFARGFALKDADKRGMERYVNDDEGFAHGVDYRDYEVSGDTSAMNDVDRMRVFTEATHSGFERDTKKEQEKRRKAAGYGTVMMGTGALLGYGIHEAIEHAADANLTVTHWFNQKFDEYWNGDNITDHFTGPQDAHQASPADGNHHFIDRDHDGIPDKHDSFIDLNHDGLDDATGQVQFNPEHIALDARWVEPGEGWYQTFQELGIPEDHWTDVLKDAGPKLHDQGWAYFDNTHQEWRISQPGRLPNSALQTIADATQRDGYTLVA